jgi:hypothetical protein
MHAYILQDWTTIRGASTVLTLTQEEEGWLDLSPYQDVIFWISATSSTNTPTITFQTSPSKDDALFMALAPGYTIPTTGVPGGGPMVVAALMSTALVPIARWLRWQLTATSGTWDATFRVLIAANSPGM